MNIGDTCQIYYSIDNSLSWIYVDGYGNGNRMPNNITRVSLNKIANDNIDGIRIRFFNSLQSIGNKPCYIDYVSITGKPLPSKEATQNPIQNTPRMVTNQDNSKTLCMLCVFCYGNVSIYDIIITYTCIYIVTLLLVTAVVLVVIFCIGSVLFYKIYALKLKELKSTQSSTAKVIKKYHNPNNKSQSFSVDIIDPTTSSFPTPHNSNHSDITKPQTHNSANTTESNQAKYIHKRYQRNPANSPSKISNEQKLESLAEGLKTDTFVTNKTNRDRKNVRIPKKQIRHNKKKGYRPHTISDSHSDYKDSSKIGNGESKTFQVISSAKYNTLLQQEMRLQSIINNAMKGGNNNNNGMIPMNKDNRNITDGQSDTASIATVTPNRGRRGTDITSVLSGNGTHGSSTCTSISPSGSSTYQSTNNLSALSSQSSVSTESTNSQSTSNSSGSTASTQSFTSSASSSLSHANTDDSSTDSNDSDDSNPSEQAKIIYKE